MAIRPLISVIIPVFNTKIQFLEKLFSSIVNQTYRNVEVIVVDDGSNPKTANFCDSYAKGRPNWVVIHQENTGANLARKTGFDKSNGDWIMFADADDIVDPTICAKLLRSCLKYKSEMSVCEGFWFDKENDIDNRSKNVMPLGRKQRALFDNQKILGGGFWVCSPVCGLILP